MIRNNQWYLVVGRCHNQTHQTGWHIQTHCCCFGVCAVESEHARNLARYQHTTDDLSLKLDHEDNVAPEKKKKLD